MLIKNQHFYLQGCTAIKYKNEFYLMKLSATATLHHKSFCLDKNEKNLHQNHVFLRKGPGLYLFASVTSRCAHLVDKHFIAIFIYKKSGLVTIRFPLFTVRLVFILTESPAVYELFTSSNVLIWSLVHHWL